MPVVTLPAPIKTAPKPVNETSDNPLAKGEASAAGPDFFALLLSLGQALPGAVTAPGLGDADKSRGESGGDRKAENSPQSATDVCDPFSVLGLVSPDLRPREASPPEPLSTAHATQTATLAAAGGPAGRDGHEVSADKAADGTAAKTPANAVAGADKAAKFAVDAATRLALDDKPANALAGEAATPATAPLAHGQETLLRAADNAPRLTLPTAVRDPNWSHEFGQKIIWLSGTDHHSAQITLNPPQMGPIEVSLNIDKGNATANFVSANAEVREAIETALPRLREMLAGVGIELGQANVGSQSFRQPEEKYAGNGGGPYNLTDKHGILANGNTGAVSAAVVAPFYHGSGLVDLFA